MGRAWVHGVVGVGAVRGGIVELGTRDGFVMCELS